MAATSTKYRAFIENIATKDRLIVFPRAKKTSFFLTVQAAERALDLRGRQLGNGWRGLVYEAGNETPLTTIAI